MFLYNVFMVGDLMKKNNKGFTLIELLAALVILSILMMFAVPTVMNLINNNRIDTYLEDAKRLVSNTEYKVRSDTKIKKPNNNECIAISMEYLQSADFDAAAPNGGSYDQSASFVIMKNVGNFQYEYYVRLVEEVDENSYIGVNFAHYDDLSKKNSNRLVNPIPSEKLISLTSEGSKDEFDDTKMIRDKINADGTIEEQKISLVCPNAETIVRAYFLE